MNKMATEYADITAETYASELRSALTSGGFSNNFNNLSDSDDPYFVVDGSGQDSYEVSFSSDFSSMTVRAGLNWQQLDRDDELHEDFLNPQDTPDECPSNTYPGQVWSASATLYSNWDVGTAYTGAGWAVWLPKDSDSVHFALSSTVDSTQSFQETLECNCTGEGEPVASCNDGGDTWTHQTTGYNSIMRSACLRQGNWDSTTWATVTGSTSGDILSDGDCERVGENGYDRMDGWEIEDEDGSTTGDVVERWLRAVTDVPHLSHEGTFDASGTYISVTNTDKIIYED